MSLNQSNHHIDPLGFQPMAFKKHLIGFAYTGAISKINLEPSPPCSTDHSQKATRLISD
jgi:hypothetical protein